MPKVSVIVPVYQVEDYLAQCLDSILAQSFLDFELIIVDDGTRDNCPLIMQQYALRDPRIRLVHKENGGLSSARNAGLDIAEGKYIAFIDSDDYVNPDFLKETIETAEKNTADLVLFNYQKFDENTISSPCLPMKDEVWSLSKQNLARYFYERWLPYVHGQEAWCRLYLRSIIEDNHLRFQPNNLVFAEDTLFSAMYLMHVHTLAALTKPYVFYRQRQDSLMALKKPRLAWRLMNLSVLLTEYTAKTGMDECLKNVLPVLCYDKLICKGIRFDPDEEDIKNAMREFSGNSVMRLLLKRLRGILPLFLYFLHTGKGIRTQWRGRAFANFWLNGNIEKAYCLVQRNEKD